MQLVQSLRDEEIALKKEVFQTLLTVLERDRSFYDAAEARYASNPKHLQKLKAAQHDKLDPELKIIEPMSAPELIDNLNLLPVHTECLKAITFTDAGGHFRQLLIESMMVSQACSK